MLGKKREQRRLGRITQYFRPSIYALGEYAGDLPQLVHQPPGHSFPDTQKIVNVREDGESGWRHKIRGGISDTSALNMSLQQQVVRKTSLCLTTQQPRVISTHLCKSIEMVLLRESERMVSPVGGTRYAVAFPILAPST
jgi:hypothetical protein